MLPRLKRPAALLCACFLLSLVVRFPSYAQDPAPPAEVTPAPEGTGELTTDGTGSDGSLPQPSRDVRYPPEFVINGDRIGLELYFRAIPQGTVGLARVALVGESGGLTIVNARARFLTEFIDFYEAEDGFYGLLAVGMEQPTERESGLDVFVTYSDGSRETVTTTVEITVGAFIRQAVTLPPTTSYLIDAPTERNELVQLGSIFSEFTGPRVWDETGFAFPVFGPLTSPFGAFRTFNESFNTRHTGWDFRITVAAPVAASAAGRVIYAGNLPIRGAHVIVDHGLGVYTGYSHLSVTHVTRGQSLEKGQIIGMVGSSGRVSGPHFHWEVSVNGEYVDGAQFITMWMP